MRVVAFAGLTSVSLLILSPTEAQSGGCRTWCTPIEVVDGSGCCVLPETEVASTADPTVGCGFGTARPTDGAGCCWPGQSWANGGCEGSPRCPSGFARIPGGDACALSSCESGGPRTTNGRACCWDGQRAGVDTCEGVALRCPTGHELASGTCVRVAIPGQTTDSDAEEETRGRGTYDGRSVATLVLQPLGVMASHGSPRVPFWTNSGTGLALQVGAELDLHIRLPGVPRVRAVLPVVGLDLRVRGTLRWSTIWGAEADDTRPDSVVYVFGATAEGEARLRSTLVAGLVALQFRSERVNVDIGSDDDLFRDGTHASASTVRSGFGVAIGEWEQRDRERRRWDLAVRWLGLSSGHKGDFDVRLRFMALYSPMGLELFFERYVRGDAIHSASAGGVSILMVVD